MTFDVPKHGAPPERIETLTFVPSKVFHACITALLTLIGCVIGSALLMPVMDRDPLSRSDTELPVLLFLCSPLIAAFAGWLSYRRRRPWLTVGPESLAWSKRGDDVSKRIAWADVEQAALVGVGVDAKVVVWPREGLPDERGGTSNRRVVACTAMDIGATDDRAGHRLRTALSWYAGPSRPA